MPPSFAISMCRKPPQWPNCILVMPTGRLSQGVSCELPLIFFFFSLWASSNPAVTFGLAWAWSSR
jgi:hypothetical protein